MGVVELILEEGRLRSPMKNELVEGEEYGDAFGFPHYLVVFDIKNKNPLEFIIMH